MFTAVFLSKEDDFCMTLGLVTGQLTCCCLMLTCFWNTNHQPQAPHWAPDFCCRFITTPSIGVAGALGLWQWIETKAQMMVYIYLFRGSGYDPQKLSVEIQT